MDHCALDPYEQQLLNVFDSYDLERKGSLDRDALTQLCQTLQLEEQGNELIRAILPDRKNSRATFAEFKEALLAILGNIQNKGHNPEVDASPEREREVSPKLVYGSKRYGRRSRPKIEDSSPTKQQNDMNYLNKTTNVQRSNSQCETFSKKRKANAKVKRCTSFPGNNDYQRPADNGAITNPAGTTSGDEHAASFASSEDMLREAWKNLGVGTDGSLNQTELILVCDAIGLHKLANGVIRQLSDKLAVDYNHKISFQELLEVLQQDDTWSDLLNTSPSKVTDNMMKLSCTITDDSTVKHISLGPDGSGIVAIDFLLDLWETAGIVSPKLLLNDLGFTHHEINVGELASILEKEIKGLNDVRSAFANPHVALLQASLALYQTEIRCAKQLLAQVRAEREKLRTDVTEANNRAALLAHEVDDNHARMEAGAHAQIRALEQKHADALREISEHLNSEKEHMSILNHSLQQKIESLETEELKLRNDLKTAQNYATTLESENQQMVGQIGELTTVRQNLSDQIVTLETDKMTSDTRKLDPLLAQLAALQLKNAQLRDRNDEMVSEIQGLGREVVALRGRAPTTPTTASSPLGGSVLAHSSANVSLTTGADQETEMSCGGSSVLLDGELVGGGAGKRRGEGGEEQSGFVTNDGSPRLGKIRKFHKKKPSEMLEVPVTSSESGFETEIDFADSSSSLSGVENDDVVNLQAKVAYLEQLLAQNSIPVPKTFSKISHLDNETTLIDDKEKYYTLLHRFREADNILQQTKVLFNELVSGNKINDELEVIFSSHIDNIEQVQSVDLTNDVLRNENDEIIKLRNVVKELTDKCNDLEACLEQLRTEYERCEDYWAAKLDDERQMFEQEQTQNSERLSELVLKLTEFEEQYTTKDTPDGRLPIIEEKCSLEQQYTDLEEEFEDFKQHAVGELEKKDESITSLQHAIERLESLQTSCSEVSIQTDAAFERNSILQEKLMNLTRNNVEATNLFSVEDNRNIAMEQARDNWTDKLHTPKTTIPLNSGKVHSSDSSISWTNTSQPQFSVTPNANVDDKKTPCRPKRTRKHDRNYVYKKTNTAESESRPSPSPHWNPMNHMEEPTCLVSINALHNLKVRLHLLDQKSRHLQNVIKQQHWQYEKVVHYYWQQQRNDKAEYHYSLKIMQEQLDNHIRIYNEQLDKLCKSDLLVKDLYVENAYLVAKVERLQGQCNLLANYSTESSSV